MANPRPLKLKQESTVGRQKIAEERPFVSVLIQAPAFHLDSVYEYQLPEELSSSVFVGSLVEIPFNNQVILGVVTARSAESMVSGRKKFISRVLGARPYLTNEVLDLSDTWARTYVGTRWDFVSLAIPPFSPVGESKAISLSDSPSAPNIPTKSQLSKELSKILQEGDSLKFFLQIPRTRPYLDFVAEVLALRAQHENVHLVAPDERDVSIIAHLLAEMGIDSIALTASAGKSERFASFASISSGASRISLGTRNSIFLPFMQETTILVLDDVDPSHYERRSPNWNTRDIALTRTNHSLVFLSLIPSLEMISLVQDGVLAHWREQEVKLNLRFATNERADGYFPTLKEGLKSGDVLIRVNQGGYVKSFQCEKCRNIALCDCGGKLEIGNGSEAKGSKPICSVCASVYANWKCTHCSNSQIRVLGKGAERIAAELGKALPGTPFVVSYAENRMDLLEPSEKHRVVVSTSGVDPYGEYAAVILIDLEQALGRIEMRSAELTRLEILRSLSNLKHGGVGWVGLPATHEFSQSLLAAKTLNYLESEVRDRSELHLPPRFGLAILETPDAELVDKAFQDILVEEVLEVIGPIYRSGKQRFILKYPKFFAEKISARLLSIKRVQSAKKEELISLRIDPYDIS